MRSAVGCGPEDEVAGLRADGDGGPRTEVFTVRAEAARAGGIRVLDMAARYPAPTGSQVYLSTGSGIAEVSHPADPVVTAAGSELVDLHATSAGGLRLARVHEGTVSIHDLPAGARALSPAIATGPIGHLSLAEGSRGRSLVVGQPTDVRRGVPVLRSDSLPDAVSLDGSAAVTLEDVTAQPKGSAPNGDESVAVVVTSIGESADPPVDLALNSADSTPIASIAGPTSPCSVPRNDPAIQVLQPSPEQVEWAAHKAVRGELTTARPANWHGNGLPAYVPQEAVSGVPGGVRVPAQVLLGVLAQESNLWQAARGALPGTPGNPLIGNYYGTVLDASGQISGVDPQRADCGYGVGQITSGMRTGSGMFTPQQQKMIATDFQVNIVAAVRFLQQKWNETKALGLKVNDGDPSVIENWYFAIWAYNTGSYPQGSGPYGVGWQNNPANSDWKFDRQYFLRESGNDARHPGDWSYPERVLGFAEHGLPLPSGTGFTGTGALSLPTSEGDQVARFVMCTAVNDCSPTWSAPGTTPVQGDRSFCTRDDRKCYWHSPVSFPPLGHHEVTIPLAASEPSVENPYPPSCVPSEASFPQPGPAGVPAGAVIVDDLPDIGQNLVGCPSRPSGGQFTFDHGTGSLGAVDTAQIGAGYGGHLWYSHTISDARPLNAVVGTWKPSGVSGWQRIMVHIPATGAESTQARYEIDHDADPATPAKFRVVNQRWNQNTWVDLGIFQLTPGATVRLSNVTNSDWNLTTKDDLTGQTRHIEVSIAWDALAFVPSEKPKVAMVALGDSYSAGEGLEPYYPNSDVGKDTPGQKNTCHRSRDAYPALVYRGLVGSATGTFANLACSGSVTADLLTSQQSKEIAQLGQGWLDENTTHVTIGIGGNDARFADVLKGCILSLTDCASSSFHLTTDDGVDPLPLIQQEPHKIDEVATPVGTILDKVREVAPMARIAVIGYPHVVAGASARSTGGFCGALTDREIDLFDAWTDRLNQVLAHAAATHGAQFVDLQPTYEGHEACARNEEWINAVIAWSDTGSGRNVPGSGSFHPKSVGHEHVAAEIQRVLDLASDAAARPFAALGIGVRQQYLDFLGRAPTADESSMWVSAIRTGSQSIDTLIDWLAHGSTWSGRRAPVTRLYWAFFLRLPDRAGLDYWVGKMRDGWSLERIAQQFARSSEFATRYGSLTNAAFVTQIYRNIYGRAPDSGGLTYWTAKLDGRTKTRGAVVAAFAEASEGRRRLAPQVDTVLVWLGMMRRMPTTTQLSRWRSSLHEGTPLPALIGQVRRSAEYARRF